MKPSIDKGLAEIARRLIHDIGPKIEPTFFSAELVSIGMMLHAVAEEFDRAAFRLVEENQAMRVIFERSLSIIESPELVEKLHVHINSKDDDLHVSALDKTNDEMRNILIKLHEIVELLDTSEGRALNDAIWAELVESTKRRKTAVQIYQGQTSIPKPHGYTKDAL